MRLKAFEVRNYRAFVEPARVELRPLTLLFGYNNVGKSALARVLPLLRDSVQGKQGLPLNLDSEAVRGGEFADLRSRQTGRRTIGFGFEADEYSSLLQRVDLTLQDLPERRQHFIEAFEIHPKLGKNLRGEIALLSSENEQGQPYDLSREGVEAGRISIDWRGLRPMIAAPGGHLEEELQFLNRLDDLLATLLNLLWVGAVRTAQPRTSRFPPTQPKSIGWDGSGAADVLAWDSQHGHGELFTEVSSWYEKHAGTPLEVSIHGDDYSLVTGAHRVNLGDTGEGLTQVLPALVAGAMAAARAENYKPSYLVVEQPELHLHPAAHEPLARFFCEIAAASSPPQMLIETHSENFLSGIQIALAQGLLDPGQVIIYWVQQDEQGNSTLVPIQLDSNGRPDYWPRGVFLEEAELMRRLAEARSKKSAS